MSSHRPVRSRRRPRRVVRLLPIVTVVVAMVTAACGAGSSRIEVADAVMPVPGSNDETSVYLTITNSGDRDDVLLNADTDIASMTMLHQTVIEDNGRASMEDDNVVKVDAGKTVRFVSGGRHLMLMKPKDLQPGDTFTLWLNFQHGGTVKTTVRVIDIGDLDL